MLRTIKSPSSPPLQSSQKEQKRTNLYSNSDSQLPMKQEADMNSSSSKRHIHGSTPPQMPLHHQKFPLVLKIAVKLLVTELVLV